MSKLSSAAVAVLSVLAVIVLVVVCYSGYWWLRRDTTNRTGEIRRDTFEFQQGRVDAAENQLADIRGIDTQLSGPGLAPDMQASLRNQRAGIVRQACKEISEVNGVIPSDLASFKAQECFW